MVTLHKPVAAGAAGCSGGVHSTSKAVTILATPAPTPPAEPTVTTVPVTVQVDLLASIKGSDPQGEYHWQATYKPAGSGEAVRSLCGRTLVAHRAGTPTDPDPDPTNPTPTTTQALVSRQFRDFLGRAPLSAELSDWTRRIELKTETIGDLVASLRGSADHLQNVDPAVRLYRAYFLRTPDAKGLDYWIGQRRGGRSLASISEFFSQSPEFRTRYGSLDNAGFVDLIYRNILARPADERGAAFWKDQLNQAVRNRGSVMIGFSESPEYIADQASEVTVSVLYALMLDRAPSSVEFSGTVALLDITDTPLPFTVANLADDLVKDANY